MELICYFISIRSKSFNSFIIIIVERKEKETKKKLLHFTFKYHVIRGINTNICKVSYYHNGNAFQSQF